MSRFTGIALVTGAGSGIGRQTALALLDAGYSVVLAGRREAALRQTAEQATQHRTASDALAVVPTDVTRPESVDTLYAEVRRRYGRLDLLFNNAGTATGPIPIEDLPYEQWRAVVDTNLTGTFLCAQ